jgi:hypothetical protein
MKQKLSHNIEGYLFTYNIKVLIIITRLIKNRLTLILRILHRLKIQNMVNKK